MERMKIEGYRECNTRELRLLIQEAKEMEYDRLFPPEVVDQLDPKGTHIICARPALLEAAARPETITHRPDGSPLGTECELSLDMAMPCEVLTKLWKHKPTKADIPKFWLDIKVESFLDLRNIGPGDMEGATRKVSDGEHRGNR